MSKKATIPPFLGTLLKWTGAVSENLLEDNGESFAIAWRLSSQCWTQQNSGIIADAKGKDSMWWSSVYGIPKPEQAEKLTRDSRFWHWKDKDLHIDVYPIVLQQAQEKKKRDGKKGGDKAKANRLAAANAAPPQQDTPPQEAGEGIPLDEDTRRKVFMGGDSTEE